MRSSEDPIVARLKEDARPAGGAVGGGSAAGRASTGSVAAAARALHRRAIGWALRRRLAPNSATGISFALGLCAAAWFTAGTGADSVNGALALCGCYLAAHASSQIAAALGAGARAAAEPSGAAGTPRAGPESRAGELARAGWLARLSCAAVECAVYAGLTVGADVAGWRGTWELAVTLTVLLALRQTMSACGGVPGLGAGGEGIVDRATGAILTMPDGGRVLLIAVAAPVWGPRATLLGLLVWAIAVIGYAIIGHGGDQVPAAVQARRDPATVVECRDDGAVARFLGQLLRGQLVPLPPALAGLAAASMLAVLGLRNLPGIIALTPLVVMLLAAPGSSHRHDGRLDWLVPAVIQAGQYVYIAALGFAAKVPGPVIFALCATIAIRSADLAHRAESSQPPAWEAGQAGTGMGWEGRMLAVGLGAIFGIATFAYLALAAYLVVLICRRVLTSYLAPGEGDRW